MENIRIVSLIASATEIVCVLGMEKYLVGVSHECDYPPSVKNLPACSSSKIEMDERSYAIDEKVKAIVQESLSVYKVDADLLEALQPTHIITQTQCDVCAVSLKDVEDAVCRITSSQPKIITLEPNSLADVWNDIKRVGNALGIPEKADSVITGLNDRMQNIAVRTQQTDHSPTVASIEWIDPLMSTGNWMPELIEMAGGVNLFGEADKHSPWMTWEQLVSKDPDIILIIPCGFDIERTMQDIPFLTGKNEWQNLKAVESNNVYVADGNQYFNRPGPRLVDSLEILAEILHPDVFQIRYEGSGWIRLQV